MARIEGSNGKKTFQKILDESLPLIARYGYSAVSMRMIANAVGINVGALYNHFESKQDILVRLLVDHMNELLSAWQRVNTADLSPSRQLETFVRFHIDYNLLRSDLVFIAYMELRSLEQENYAKIQNLRGEYEAIVQKIIVQGLSTQQFNVEDPHIATMSVLGSLVGVNTWYQHGGRLSKTEIEDCYVAMTLRSVGHSVKDAKNV